MKQAVAGCWLIFAACLTAVQAASESDRAVMVTDHNNQVRLLNVGRDTQVDVDAVKAVADRIAHFVQQTKLTPTRVEIDADHPIVKQALSERTMEITIADTATVVFVPFSHNANRIIVKRGHSPGETYTLFSLQLDAGVDLKACFR